MNPSLRYFLGSFAAAVASLSLSAVTLVSPKEGETVCLLNDGNRAFLSMDAAARRKIFTDTAWRHEAAKKWRSVPKPVALRWADAKNKKVRVTVTKRGADKPWFDEYVAGGSVEVWNLEIAREYEWTVDGGRVRQGLVYRSQGLNNNASYYLNSNETMALYI